MSTQQQSPPPTPFEQLVAARSRFDTSRAAVTGGGASAAVVEADKDVATAATALNVARTAATDARGRSNDVLVELHAAGQAAKDGIDAVLANHPLP